MHVTERGIDSRDHLATIMRTANYQFVPLVVRWIIIAMAIALALLIASVAAACPTCKEGLAQNDPHGQSIAAGYYYSILFMMSMPFAILGTFGGLAYLSIRRARNQAVPNPSPGPGEGPGEGI